MRTQCNWPFVIVLAGFALLGAYLGYGLAHHPKLVWFKPLNILGLAYGLLGIVVLSEFAVASPRITGFFVNWVAGILLWGQSVVPLGAALAAWLTSSGPSSSVAASFFVALFVYSLVPLALLDSFVFNDEARARVSPEQRSRVFGLLLLVFGTLVQLVAALHDLYA
jgi:hypothetical protein